MDIMAKNKQPEKAIQNKIIAWLNKQPYTWAVKFPGIWTRGVPDILCCHMGEFYGFEVKVPGGKVTPIQEAVIHKIHVALGDAHVVHSLDEVKEILGND